MRQVGRPPVVLVFRFVHLPGDDGLVNGPSGCSYTLLPGPALLSVRTSRPLETM